MKEKMLLDQRAELERQLKDELEACRATRRKIQAIDLLLGHTGSTRNNRELDSTPTCGVAAFEDPLGSLLADDRRGKSIMGIVRATLKDSRGTFTSGTLVEAIKRTHSCSLTERDVSHPLWQLQKLGVIRVFKKGSGKRPTIYLKA